MEFEVTQSMIVNLSDLVPKEHFLRKLTDNFPWNDWAKPFEKCFKGEKEYGPKGYPVPTLLKMTVLSYLYDLGDKQTENFVREANPARYFAGLSLLQPVPDETTICRFRNRIAQKGKDKLLHTFFSEILKYAQKKGIEMGKVQVLDSTHTNSKVNLENENRRQKENRRDGEPPSAPLDPDAKWGCKGSKRKKDPETGEIKEEKQWFFGYKCHASLNQKTGLITSLLVSPGNKPDNEAARWLLENDLSQGLKLTVVTADKAYDDGDLYAFCGGKEIFPAVNLRKSRTEQKNKKIVKHWEEHKKLPFYEAALKKRYKVEQKFGEAKCQHGLGRCRYFRERKYGFQAIFTFLSMNLKRILKLVFTPAKRRLSLCRA